MSAFYDIYLGAIDRVTKTIRTIGPYYLDSVKPSSIYHILSSWAPEPIKIGGWDINEEQLSDEGKALFGKRNSKGDWVSMSHWISAEELFIEDTNPLREGYIAREDALDFFSNKNDIEYLHFSPPFIYPPEYVVEDIKQDYMHIAYIDHYSMEYIRSYLSQFMEQFEFNNILEEDEAFCFIITIS